MEKLELQKIANEVRKDIVTALHSAKAGHPTELCTALPISINASTGIPKAFPYAGSNTNALIKHATTAVSTVPVAIPITACFLLLTDL